jgi:hypothetical protein
MVNVGGAADVTAASASGNGEEVGHDASVGDDSAVQEDSMVGVAAGEAVESGVDVASRVAVGTVGVGRSATLDLAQPTTRNASSEIGTNRWARMIQLAPVSFRLIQQLSANGYN